MLAAFVKYLKTNKIQFDFWVNVTNLNVWYFAKKDFFYKNKITKIKNVTNEYYICNARICLKNIKSIPL